MYIPYMVNVDNCIFPCYQTYCVGMHGDKAYTCVCMCVLRVYVCACVRVCTLVCVYSTVLTTFSTSHALYASHLAHS